MKDSSIATGDSESKTKELREKNRSSFSIIFLIGYLVILVTILAFCFVNAEGEVNSIFNSIIQSLSTSLGFILGYYFKNGSNEN